ncbi:preprotein translocase subunit SecY [Nonomuraea sp. NPDC050556]|uniref:preprotein translocase subunit SecY n=1 Tax=Nonomuraea sp. NPDC050556 TaxID=3364369 RepID=UPI00378A5B86
MLSLFTRAFRVPDLRKKMLFTLGIIVLFRIGQIMPAPGVDVVSVRECLGGARGGVMDMLQLFSGGAMLKLSVFALGIMPYITASILVQLLTTLIPRLEALRKQGQSGQARITQYTRYLTVGLATLNATVIVALARNGTLMSGCAKPLLHSTSLLAVVVVVVTMVAGTCVVMWFGELITDRGIGNGMSILIFTQVVAVFPSYLSTIYLRSPVALVVMLVAGVVLVATVVFVEQAQRRIPVTYARRLVGRRMYGGTSTYIPLKVNQAGIVPVIFASSLLALPSMAAPMLGDSFGGWIQRYLVAGDHPLYMTVYTLLIVGFTYFYVSITFNPVEVADNMRKYGGFVPGIRPGRPTAQYLAYVLSRLTAPGAAYLGALSLIPLLAFAVLKDPSTQANFPFGGSTVLIMVSVGLDTVKQIEAQLQQRNYEALLR